ncbi:BA14K family protein [Phyllobacterium myrsinacearum]|uniref:BA14K family protein n=1 Tax=Phyllobacterium myrsinacearum TaxID=28101 RepID=UPI0015F8CB7E|nr:BA14K family protein [Phyllobacterium myrsinacearum]
MRRLAIVFLSLATAFSSYVPAQAFPTVSTVSGPKADIVQIRDRGHFRRHNNWRGGRHDGWRGDRHHSRHGWRRGHHNRAGAVIGGLAAGAIIGGALSSAARANSAGSHEQSCYNRYRSYRASDNTYQPNSGPRRQCQ